MRRRARTPVVLQMEATECGAAALASILAYHGRVVPLEELRLACGVSRDGSRASNVVRAARHYGLTARALKKETEQLAEIALPAIIFWSFNHFVVLEAINAKGAWLNDPAFGHRFVPPDEFDESFTGVVLTFAPGEAFRPARAPGGLARALLSRLQGAGGSLGFAVLAAAGLVVPALAAPAYISLFIDQVLVRKLDTWLMPLVGVMIAAGLLSAGFVLLQQFNLARLRIYLALTQSMRFVWHVLRLPVGYFTQRYAIEVATRTTLNDRLAELLAGDLAVSILNCAVIVIYAVVMAQYDLVLTAIGVGFATLNLLALMLVSRRLVDLGRRRQMDGGLLRAATVRGFGMLDTLKATGTENLFLARWAGYHAKLLNAEQSVARTEALLAAVPMALGLISSVVVVVVGGQRVMDGALTIGMLLGFQALLGLFSSPVNQLVDFGGELQEVRASLERLDDVLRQALDPGFTNQVEAGVAFAGRIGGTLRMAEIRFGYSPLDEPLIDGFALALPPGARVGLVGRSGSGKSTIGRLAIGLYQPWSGEITLDGHELASIPRDTLRHSVAYVDQSTALFPGTVRDNIALWDPTMPEERLVEATRDAMIYQEVAARPLGFDHPVAENGRDFSGGQRQRMMIARALALDPLLIVLDEATNELDTETEFQIMESIRRRGCGCIVIAHRLSTVRLCDEIIVMDQGRIIERGTHDALMARDGEYRSLVNT
jgi:NHLM bacteriocin system ABC transporter peptidase/ATP-binding protein